MTESTGSWGGRFSTDPLPTNGLPSLAAGTIAADWSDADGRGTLVGARAGIPTGPWPGYLTGCRRI